MNEEEEVTPQPHGSFVVLVCCKEEHEFPLTSQRIREKTFAKEVSPISHCMHRIREYPLSTDSTVNNAVSSPQASR